MSKSKSKQAKQAFNPGKDKLPVQTIEPGKGKQPKEAAGGANYAKQTPVWLFSRLDWDGPWCFSKARDLREIVVKLAQFEGMTWAEIAGRRHHLVDVGGMCKKAQDQLDAIGLDDQEHLFSFALSNLERIYGVREDRAFLILWWDPIHEVYPSKQ